VLLVLSWSFFVLAFVPIDPQFDRSICPRVQGAHIRSNRIFFYSDRSRASPRRLSLVERVPVPRALAGSQLPLPHTNLLSPAYIEPFGLKKGQNALTAPYLESAALRPPGIEGSAAALQHRRCLSPSVLTDLCPFQFIFSAVLVFFPVGCTITWCDKV
jgi:hypothetical protein